MNELDRQLDRLFKWAGHAPEAGSTEMPYGFATRVVAQWQAAREELWPAVWERLAYRAVFFAGVALMLGVVMYVASSRREIAYDYPLTYSTMEVASVP